MEVPDIIESEFTEEAKQRDEDPQKALERLMIDYIAGRDRDAMLEDVHEAVVGGDAVSTASDDDDGNDVETAGGDTHVSSLSEYDPIDDQRLTRTAMEMLPDYDENIEIDREDIPCGVIPSAVDVKQALIAAVVRHENDVVSTDDVVRVADDLVGINSQYLREQYVDAVLDDIDGIYVGRSVDRTFFDEDAAMSWMDDRLEEDGVAAEQDVVSVILALHSRGVSIEELDEYGYAVGLEGAREPVDAFGH